MRRGHIGVGGWRSENPRHYRPRGDVNAHFRPGRNYGLLDAPRFPVPGDRLHRPSNSRNYGHSDDHDADYQHRHGYRDMHHHSPRQHRNRGRYQKITGQRQILPYISHNRPGPESKFSNPTNYFESKNNAGPCNVNSLGDIDHRKLTKPSRPDYPQNHGILSPWSPPRYDNKNIFQDKSPLKYQKQSVDSVDVPILSTYPHRPPASDHYAAKSSLENCNNNTSFTRSVDDTVDIVRKRLLNRSEPQRGTDDDHQQTDSEVELSNNSYQNVAQEQPVKRRIQSKSRQISKSNCDKMKNNIVHQLFKMDKDKIHKLMDNPNSSTKFEFAISSLITESQNSLSRHLRSVAEKSLTSSSTDFINDDNNTIYEDTFMKQMQCILDPQDTVLLEDIKPIVLAELSKVLQLDNNDQMYEMAECEGQGNIYNTEYQDHNDDYIYSNLINDENPRFSPVEDECNKNPEFQYTDIKPLFERRDRTIIRVDEERRQSSESRMSRRSMDRRQSVDRHNSESMPLFEANTEQLSDEEDPFAELDKQYHVAVGLDFIEPDDCNNTTKSTSSIISPLTATNLYSQKATDKMQSGENTAETASTLINVFEPQHDILPATPNKSSATELNFSQTSDQNKVCTVEKSADMKQEKTPDIKENENIDPAKLANMISTVKTCSTPNSRKRSIDQRPSHRKEKRKKSDTCLSDSNKLTSNRESSSHINESPEKSNDRSHNSSKLIFNYFSKHGNSKRDYKRAKRREIENKKYSNKYVKRKENDIQEKNKKYDRHHHSDTPNHSIILSPEDSRHKSNNSQSSSKTDPKIKLKTIDMFLEQPKKGSSHHSHRNTAVTSSNKTPEDIKLKTVSTNLQKQVKIKTLTKITQTTPNCATKMSQTEEKKTIPKETQTDTIDIPKKIVKATDALERMKEIDLEIQALLEEKFKLYHAFENDKSAPCTVETLGMAVLNVNTLQTQEQDNQMGIDLPIEIVEPISQDIGVTLVDVIESTAEDLILDDFANIPVEELEQIALETVEEEPAKPEQKMKRITRRSLERDDTSTPSPTTVKRSMRRGKGPLEQNVTQQYPVVEIVDDLEQLPVPPVKKKPARAQTLKKKGSKKGKINKVTTVQNFPMTECSVLLERIDISNYFYITDQESIERPDSIEILEATSHSPIYSVSDDTQDCLVEEVLIEVPTEIIEESTSHIQFDMLDVSEDIVIGDSSDAKSRESDVPVSEEIILDNSQSSCEDAAPESTQSGPVCKTYDFSTDEQLKRETITVTGNADAVLAIECIDNDFIAACLDGNVYHYRGDGQLVNTLRGSNLAVTCMTIVKEKHGTTVYTGSLDSRIRYYDLETGVEKGPECNVLSPIQTMDRAWDTVFVGTRTGFVLQFECKNNMLIPVSTVKFSEQSILSLRAMKEGPRKVLLVAARSEDVTIKDAQTGLLLRTLIGPKMTVYTLLFEDGKVYCGTSSHQIHVFDYSTGSHVGSHSGGKGAVCLRATGGLVFAGCYDGCVYVYREGETRPLAQLRGPSLMLLSLAVVGSKIIAGYKDRGLYIWKIPLNILQEMIL